MADSRGARYTDDRECGGTMMVGTLSDGRRAGGGSDRARRCLLLALVGALAVACEPSSGATGIRGSHGRPSDGSGSAPATLPGTPDGPAAGGSASASVGASDGSSAPVRQGTFDLRYWIDAARPPTSLVLHILPNGTAELYLGTSPLPVQTDVLGQFRAPVPADLLARIDRHVQEHNLADGDRGESATAEGSGAITLANGPRRSILGLASADDDIQTLRTMLDDVLASVAKHPFRGVRLAVTGSRDGTNLVPELSLEHVGSEPVAILLCEAAPSVMCTSPVVTARAGAAEIGASRLEGQALTALVKSGELPAGAFPLAPGRSVRLRMPAIPVPSNVVGPVELVAKLNLWFAGPGLDRRSGVLEAAWPSGTAATAAPGPTPVPPLSR
jgi:hypothetical protein